ncbi:MAG TPA: signal peptide peptidase SppA [Jiangellaceae bacterium]|nr:signal peptide peptidase SppA [Jiangellaceae bacterium]
MLPRAKHAAETVVTSIEEVRRRRTADLLLELDLTEPLMEDAPQDPVGAVLARRRAPLRTVLQGLHRAARDGRVRGLVVKLGGSRSPLGLAQAQELLDAVRDLRDHGKVTVAWAETFGEFGNGSIPYSLATGFEEVWLQPSGDVGLTGAATEVPFLRGVLDKAGITPQIAQRHEYKNAANLFTEREFTAPHREATERVVQSVMEQLVATIAANRELDPDHVRDLIDRAPLFATEALEAGLVDHLGYRDDVYAAVRSRAGADVVLQFLGRYRRSKLAQLSTRVTSSPPDTVALVHVTGPIHLGRSRRQPLVGTSAGADTVAAALRAATKADDVKAIVLRVVSPGGSYVASDAIWRQVAVTRQAGKPVVVSMGDVAASGGYFVSMGADLILAEPGTVTGSIGVVSGKHVVDGLVERLGIGHEGVAGGKHGLMFSPLRAFTEDEWDRLNVWLDRIYDDFTAKVADGRGLSGDRVREIARGRVWTGADAKERGLIDDLGGLRAALDVARERAGLPPSDEFHSRAYPRLPLATRLRPAHSSEDPAAARAVLRVEAWGPFTDLATRLGLSTHGPLMLPAEHDLAW